VSEKQLNIELVIDTKKWIEDISDNLGVWSKLDILPWGGNYKPETYAVLSRNTNGINVIMRCYEKKIRAEVTKRNDFVCTDSCMEFFFAPMPTKSLAYFNFEVNPKGVMYIGYSEKGTREGSNPINAPDNDYFDMKALIKDDFWQISYHIPYELIKKFIPSFDENKCDYITGNFYKCGDLTQEPHYLVWNNIENSKPDYHLPAFFGRMLF